MSHITVPHFHSLTMAPSKGKARTQANAKAKANTCPATMSCCLTILLPVIHFTFILHYHFIILELLCHSPTSLVLPSCYCHISSCLAVTASCLICCLTVAMSFHGILLIMLCRHLFCLTSSARQIQLH
jgi:hypothetical protein